MKLHFLALSLIIAGGTGAQAQQGGDKANLALGKKFTCSDPNIKQWHSGLTDGSWVPGRGTTFATGDSKTFPKTATVDLEETKTLGYIAFGVPPFGSTKTVSVSLSTDGATFTEVGRTEFAAGREKKLILDFKPVSARYIRLTYHDYHPERYRYTPTYAFTTELAAYAPGAAPLLPPTAAATPELATPAVPTVREPADSAAPKTVNGVLEDRFSKAHESFLKRGKEGPIGVLFIGDSITDYWRREANKDIWSRFERYNPANFGIGGDKTQNVLWRFENGELDGIKPKVVVLMIGTNNIGRYPNQDVIEADKKIVAEIHRRLPETKLLLLGIFPRGTVNDPKRAAIKTVNAELAKLEDGQKTRYLDIGGKFLEADGSIAKETMYDALHPGPRGYQIWADAMSPLLDEMMK